jgi:phosphoglycolate phosphatase-like HAD superfamily hydrolase
MKLILFDIDGTLVLTGGAGGRAMARAAQDVFGFPDADQSISMAGRTDTWIVAQMAAQIGGTIDDDIVKRFHDVYIRHLLEEIERPAAKKGLLPGVVEILEDLSARDDVYLGLLTGNFHRGARIKLEYFDIWRYFRGGAFGDDGQNRNGLLGTAITRVVEAGGPAFSPTDVVIVGDTPLDVEVATVGGARSLAVATGPYTVEMLRDSGADVVLEDLRDQEAVVAGLMLASGPDDGSPGRR